MHASLAKRWKAQDREIFVMAFILNPYIRLSCFPPDHPFTTFGIVWKMLVSIYKRMWHTTDVPDTEFRNAFKNYFFSTGAFSDEAMSLEELLEDARSKVCTYLAALVVCTANCYL